MRLPASATRPPPSASLTAASAPPARSRGIGMMIESDFYSTAAGREHFKDQLQSIRYW